METQDPPIRLVVQLDDVELDVRVDQRLRYLAEHLGMDRPDVAAKLLEMVFREGLDWEDITYVRALTEDAVPDEDTDPLAGLACLDLHDEDTDEA